MTESLTGQHPVDGLGCVLSRSEIAQTAGFIASAQCGNGQIPWFRGGQTDPWDHVEAAMALDAAGRSDEAWLAYEWLRTTQNPDGSWFHQYRGGEVVDRVRESNFTAYVAVGVWHHHQCTADDGFLDRMWPTIVAAMTFVLGLQGPGGQIDWACNADGAPSGEALLTGCASMYQSLRCALAIARHRGEVQPDWELAAAALGHAVASHPERFADRDRYSMDWYYPVLGGAVRRPAAARTRLDQGWERFVVPGLGVRCVSDRPWVTVAETSELVLTLCAIGDVSTASQLHEATRRLRCGDGSYWTGYVYPDDAVWPEERTTWTAGAVLLAAVVLAGHPATTAVFVGAELPAGPRETAAACSSDACPAIQADPR